MRQGCQYLFENEKGLTHARNIDARQSTSEILVFIDDDILIPYCFLKEHETLFFDPKIHAAKGMILVHNRDDGTFKPLVPQVSLPMRKTMIKGGNFAIRRSGFISLEWNGRVVYKGIRLRRLELGLAIV